MKYVIFKNKTGLVIPVVSPDHATHSSMKVEGFEVVSAGFVYLTEDGTIDVTVGSESLKIKEDENQKEFDKTILASMFANAGIYAFLFLV